MSLYVNESKTIIRQQIFCSLHLKISEKSREIYWVWAGFHKVDFGTYCFIEQLKYEKIEKIHEGAANSSLSVCFEKFSNYEYLFILCTKNHKHVIFTSNSDNELI